MIVVANIWMEYTAKEATEIVIEKNTAVPNCLCLYIDDCWGILKQNPINTTHINFAACLSEVDERLKFMYEIEENRKIPFLDALIL